MQHESRRRPLVGTTMTWLLLDVTFYGTGSFKHRVSASLDPGGSEGAMHARSPFGTYVS